jgi:hypothetical protein
VIIRKEYAVTTTEVSFEGEIFIRKESEGEIQWSKIMETSSFKFQEGRWKKRLRGVWTACDLPELERKYQELKSCS